MKGNTLIFFSVLDKLGVVRPEAEYQFYEKRKWRFDYAWPRFKVALEVEGGVWTGGRHTRGAGFVKDMEKYNTAAMSGWRIIRVVPGNLLRAETIELIQSTLSNN